MELERLGWSEALQEQFAPHAGSGLIPARVARVHGRDCLVYTEQGEMTAGVTGRMKYEAESSSELPAVGDWLALQPLPEGGRGTVRAVLPRKSCFSRKVPGSLTEEQVVATNIDTLFLVTGLDRDFNLRRIERFLTLAWDSGANPVVVLNKADLCDQVEVRVAQVEEVAYGVPVHPISAVAGEGLEPLDEYLGIDRTVALLGSSGVGKSTLINSLIGEEVLEVGRTRTGDGRGRHTTTHRELVLLPEGGVLIDNPGIREVPLWADEEGLKGSFGDIESLGESCRFRDCRHEGEPGCAIREALEEGELDPGRYDSYRRMQRELRHLAARQDQKARMAEKERGKQIARWARQFNKNR